MSTIKIALTPQMLGGHEDALAPGSQIPKPIVHTVEFILRRSTDHVQWVYECGQCHKEACPPFVWDQQKVTYIHSGAMPPDGVIKQLELHATTCEPQV